jgi:hypothetical protein
MKPEKTWIIAKQLDHQLAACDVPEAADFREAFAAL